MSVTDFLDTQVEHGKRVYYQVKGNKEKIRLNIDSKIFYVSLNDERDYVEGSKTGIVGSECGRYWLDNNTKV